MRMWWLLCAAVPVTAQAQELDLVLSPLGVERIPWREVRVPNRAQWLARAGISLDSFAPEDLDGFRVVDVDADGRPDIVFNGGRLAGSEGVETRVYRNAGTHFQTARFFEEELYALGRLAADHTPALVLRDQPYGMCDVSDRRLRFLRRAAARDTALYEQFDEVRYGLAGSRWPRAALATPFRVRVTQDRYNLRSAPALDDTTDVGDCEEHHGNVFAILSLGATARVLAQQQVGTRLWYFVMTDPGTTVAWPGDRGGETAQARLLGWFSARWTERIATGPPQQPPTPPRRGRA